MTSVHPREDNRIYKKEILSLRESGFDVNFIVADGKTNDPENGIIDVGRSTNRIKRMIFSVRNIKKACLKIDADIYHFHDPELIPLGAYLKRKGKTVVFDSHEDVTKQILSKPYLNSTLLKILSNLYGLYEKIVCKKFDLIITATPAIKEKFIKINKNVDVINNYPLTTRLRTESNPGEKEDAVCYVGGISRIRGITEIIKAMEYTEGIKLILAGSYDEQSLLEKHRTMSGWKNVEYLGYADESLKTKIYGKAKAGLVTFLCFPNHIDAQPNKMFEYMGEGLPVIASDFELWRQIIENNRCGICVDPENPEEIAKAITYIVKNPNKAEEMNRNGQEAVRIKYNWAIEKEKLINLYKGLCSSADEN